ncbi:unnamed protein product [Alternaria alternata]
MTSKLIVSHNYLSMDYLPMVLSSILDVATIITNCRTWSVYRLQSEVKDRFFFSMGTCLVRGYLRWAQNTVSRLNSFDGIFIFGARLTGLFFTLSLEPHLLLPAKDSDDSKATDGSLFQTASHLPSELHIMLDDHAIAGQDPLYALAPVLLFAAASENQLLSALQRWHDIIVSTKWDQKLSTEHLEQLILHKNLLDDHANRHEDVLRFIESPVLARWANALTQDQQAVAQESKDAVKADFEFLLSRYRQLSLHYQEAISILVSATSLAESQKQITLAAQVTKLTILATIFLPLSYCTSIFGMNFVELDQLSIWIWVVVTFAVGLSTFLVYQWDERQRLEVFWTMMQTKAWRMRSRRSTSTTV